MGLELTQKLVGLTAGSSRWVFLAAFDGVDANRSLPLWLCSLCWHFLTQGPDSHHEGQERNCPQGANQVLGQPMTQSLVPTSIKTWWVDIHGPKLIDLAVFPTLPLSRAEEVELLLELEGAHKKDPSSHMHGVVRATLKTDEGRDLICISDAVWDPDHAERLGAQAAQDVMAAAAGPLESALAVRCV